MIQSLSWVHKVCYVYHLILGGFMTSLFYSLHIICLCIIFLASAPPTALTQESTSLSRITMTGVGINQTPPDMAQLSTGVETRGKTAREATRANSEAMQAVIKALKDAGLEDKQLKTSQFSLVPEYIYPRDQNGQSGPPKLTGYRVSNQLTITIDELQSLGTLLDMVITAGANQVGTIRFGLKDPSKAADTARQKAAADASRKARLYAEATGMALGRVLSITEGAVGVPASSRARAEALAFQAADAVPIVSGQESVRASATITWELISK